MRLDRPIMRGMFDDKTRGGFADREELEAAKRRFGWRGIDDFPKREDTPASYRVFHSVEERGSSTAPTTHVTMPWTQRWELPHNRKMAEVTIDLGDVDYRYPYAS